MTLTPSPRQAAIFAHAERLNQHLLVQACAGSGKTTTLVGICQRLPQHLRVLALSFNKSIAEELGRRMPPHVKSATMHSVGFASVRRSVRGVLVDDKKLQNIISSLRSLGDIPSALREVVMSDLRVCVPLAQDMHLDGRDIAELVAACERTGRTLEVPTTSLPLVAEVIQIADATKNVIDFGDMVRHPVVHQYPAERYNVVLVDEAQDLNCIQHNFLRQLVSPGGVLIAVGDRAQSIYGFRGADPASMNRLRAEWNATELPLDVSYRCPTKVVALAQQAVGDLIQPAPGAPEGEVIYRKESEVLATVAEAQAGDMFLCRVNAPLVGICFRLIKAGIKATVRGRDIGAGLAALIRRLHASDVQDLLMKLGNWENDQSMKALAAGKPIEPIQDKADTLRAVVSECQTIPETFARIDAIFSDAVQGVILSTVHKAKGLESQRVVILAPELLPAPWAKSPEEIEQERNLWYVAITRSMHRLVLQPLPKIMPRDV